ncbi:MAG: response regulator [Pricia sp.]
MNKIASICIIDDDPITVFGIRKMLSLVVDCDNVSSYANGQLALNGIRAAFEKTQNVPEVLFLDINMPIMDGWQFLEAFISLPLTQKVRVNIVTSSIDPLDRQNYEKYRKKTGHVLSYNQKPIRKANIETITKRA